MPPRQIDSLDALKALAGNEVGVSEWHTVTQEQIDAFAATTGDRQWIHVDVDRAKRDSPFGTTIAHGFMTLSLISSFMKQAVEIKAVRMAINYGLNRVRFPAPVLSGSQIRARFALVSAKDIAGGAEIVYGVTIESRDDNLNAGAKPRCAAEWVIRYYA